MLTVSGLDMGMTIQWYEQNSLEILKRLPPQLLRLADVYYRLGLPYLKHRMVITRDCPCDWRMFVPLIRLFSSSLRQRSNLVGVEIEDSAWFKKGDGLLTTTEVAEAFSPTAIVPSFVKYSHRSDLAPFTFGSTIVMYKLSDWIPRHVQLIIWSEGFLHEFCHTIVTPFLYNDGRLPKLRLPNGTVVPGDEYLFQYSSLVEMFKPISHYASTYFNTDGTLSTENVLTSIGENVVEGLVALLLGFAFRLDGTGLDPFREREPLREYLLNFLNSESVSG